MLNFRASIICSTLYYKKTWDKVKYSDPLLALLEVRDTEQQVIIIEYLSKQSLITVYTKMKETPLIFCIRNK